MIVEIIDPNEKQAIARKVLEALIDWFGIKWRGHMNFLTDAEKKMIIDFLLDNN